MKPDPMTQRGETTTSPSAMTWPEWRYWNRDRPILNVWREFKEGVAPAVLRMAQLVEAAVFYPPSPTPPSVLVLAGLGERLRLTPEDVRNGWHPGPFKL